MVFTYISTRNNVILYFLSASNRINLFILGHVRIAISRKRLNRLWKKLVLLLHPENWAQVDQPSSVHYINGWCRFSRKLLRKATHRFTQVLHSHLKLLHLLLPVGSKSHKRVYFVSYLIGVKKTFSNFTQKVGGANEKTVNGTHFRTHCMAVDWRHEKPHILLQIS